MHQIPHLNIFSYATSQQLLLLLYLILIPPPSLFHHLTLIFQVQERIGEACVSMRSTIFINDVAFEVASGPFNIRAHLSMMLLSSIHWLTCFNKPMWCHSSFTPTRCMLLPDIRKRNWKVTRFNAWCFTLLFSILMTLWFLLHFIFGHYTIVFLLGLWLNRDL
jgi:hypothetical protein